MLYVIIVVGLFSFFYAIPTHTEGLLYYFHRNFEAV